jgi:hypothetical protein
MLFGVSSEPLLNVKAKNRITPTPLAKGQLWKLDSFHIEIVEMGKNLTHYKRLHHLKQKGVPVKLERIDVVENFLRTNKATLVTK